MVAQELVNSLQVFEVTTGAMAQELKSLVGEYTLYTCEPQTQIIFYSYLELNRFNVLLFFLAVGAAPSAVRVSTAPVHGSASHGSSLCWRVQ